MAGMSTGDDHDGITEEATSSKRDNIGKTETETDTKMEMRKIPSVISLAIARTASYPTGVSSMDSKELIRGLCKGVLLDDNKVKFWVDDKLHKNCFILFGTTLTFTSGTWHWDYYDQEDCFGGPVDIVLARLQEASGFDISGKLPSMMLSTMTTYEVVFVFKITADAGGLDIRINLGLSLPNKTTQNRTEDLGKKQKGQWLEILLGDFEVNPENIGYIEFLINLQEGGYINKRMGLVVKGVIFRPKYSEK